MMKTKNAAKLMAAAFCLLGAAVPAASASGLQNFDLDPMVVTAQRMERDELSTPASVNVLSHEQIKQTGATSAYDALKFTTGITAYGFGPNGQAWGNMSSKILIRGNDKGTLVMIDGAPINMNNLYHLQNLPADAIERIEIVKGASSVLYGSEAASGVINIITRKNAGNALTVSKGEYGKTRQSLMLQEGKAAVVANLEQGQELKGYSTNGRAMNDGKKSSVLLRYAPDDAFTISHEHAVNDYHFNQYDTKNWNIQKENSHFKNIEDFLRVRYDKNDWIGNLYFNRSDRSNRTSSIKAGAAKPKKFEDTVFKTYGLDLQKYIETPFAGIIVGTTLERQDYDADIIYSGGKLKNEGLDKNMKTYALFLQMNKDLGHDFSVTAGMRQQWMKANEDYDAFTPEIAILKKLDDRNSVYVNAGKSFKMPNFTSLYGSGSVAFEPNPNLKPEEGWTYEAGYKKMSDSSLLKGAVYYVDMDKAWVFKTVANDKNKPFNAAFKNLGLELSYEKNIGDHFAYSLGVDISNPRARVDGEWVRRYAREQYTGSLKYNNRDFNTALTTSITADRAGGWKAKAPMNCYMNYRFNPHNSMGLVVENVLNRKDIVGNWTKPGSTEYYSLPRNIRVNYTYNF